MNSTKNVVVGASQEGDGVSKGGNTTLLCSLRSAYYMQSTFEYQEGYKESRRGGHCTGNYRQSPAISEEGGLLGGGADTRDRKVEEMIGRRCVE